MSLLGALVSSYSAADIEADAAHAAQQQQRGNQAFQAPQKREMNYQILMPLVYAPLLPLIRIGMRGRFPQSTIDKAFGAGVFLALGHAGYIMASDSSV
jgi:hypothetical protein